MIRGSFGVGGGGGFGPPRISDPRSTYCTKLNQKFSVPEKSLQDQDASRKTVEVQYTMGCGDGARPREAFHWLSDRSKRRCIPTSS